MGSVDDLSPEQVEENRARYEAWVSAKYGGKAACPECGSAYIATTLTTEIEGSNLVRYANYCFGCQHRREVEAPSAVSLGATDRCRSRILAGTPAATAPRGPHVVAVTAPGARRP